MDEFWNLINKFNNFSNNYFYKNIFNSLWLGTFILGLLFEKLYGRKKKCKLPGTIANLLHHLSIFVIYFSWLAPAYLLIYVVLFAISALFSWIFLKNTCFLTTIENMYCTPKMKYFHDFMDYIEPINFGKFNLKYRTYFINIINIIIIIRLYAYLFKDNKKLEIQAHRGGRGYLPENTLPAFENSLKNNIETLELDTHLTKDNEIIVYHDDKINNLCINLEGENSNYLISEMTLSEIKKYDCGSIKNIDFPEQKTRPGTKIPTLKELFDFINNSNYPISKTVKFNIEIKTYDNEPEIILLNHTKELLKIIKDYKLENRVIIQSFDIKPLMYIEQKYPFIKTSYLVRDYNDTYIKDIKQNNIDIISPNYKILNTDIVNKIQSENIKIIPYTVNNINDFERLSSYNIDGVITDYPLDFKQHYDLFM